MLTELHELSPHTHEIALSYGLEHLIRTSVEGSNGQLTAESLAVCALRLYPEKMVKMHLEDLSIRFVNRVERLSKAKQEESSKQPKTRESSNPKRTLGANLEEWTHTLDPSGICLYLADYDPERAHRLYWWVDSDLLEIALRAKLRFASVVHTNNFEAAMYGFGGKYKDDDESSSESDEQSFDLNTPEGQQAFKGFTGFNF